jgi:tetratricopeptide (TPR) repeat protein
MNLISKIALGAALGLGVATISAAPAMAKKEEPQAPPDQAGQRKLVITKEERAAIMPLQTAVTANDFTAAAAALPAAQAAAQGVDAKYVVASLKLKMGLGTNDTRLQAQAIDDMIASGGVQSEDLPKFYQNQGAFAAQSGDNAKAEASFAKLVELTPNDPEAVVMLAEAKYRLKKNAEAVALVDRAISLKQAAGGPVLENWYKRGLKMAYDAQLGPQSIKISRELVSAYPSATNWRDALLIFRSLTNADRAMDLDILRLSRAAKALSGERDYYDMADTLNDGGLPGETKAVLDEGVAVKMVDPNKPAFKAMIASSARQVAADRASLAGLGKQAMAAKTGTAALHTADDYIGYGDYTNAIPLYRAALQKGSIDANLVNTHLGMALALAGQKAEAEAAFHAVTGPRAELAAYWLIWLSQRS